MPKRHFTFFDSITQPEVYGVLDMAGISRDRLSRHYELWEIRLRRGDLPKLKAAVHLSPDMETSTYIETSATSIHNTQFKWEGSSTGHWRTLKQLKHG